MVRIHMKSCLHKNTSNHVYINRWMRAQKLQTEGGQEEEEEEKEDPANRPRLQITPGKIHRKSMTDLDAYARKDTHILL